jgi:hypothetical protein
MPLPARLKSVFEGSAEKNCVRPARRDSSAATMLAAAEGFAGSAAAGLGAPGGR